MTIVTFCAVERANGTGPPANCTKCIAAIKIKVQCSNYNGPFLKAVVPLIDGLKQQQYLFAIGGWTPEGHIKPIKAGSKRK